jgi:DNA-directed RNA polymerase sigma subunit (sigma70/sigma32)
MRNPQAVDREISLEEIGKQMGVTRERIRQIEVSGLRKLKAALERRGIDQAYYLEYLREHVATDENFF